MSTALISLIGEQPAPNLLPARYLKPTLTILVYTGRTERVAKNLKSLLEPGIRCEMCKASPYSITDAFIELERCLKDKAAGHETIFNLTGGTKTMVLAAFHLARKTESSFVYLQTEGNKSLLYRYGFKDDEIVRQTPPEEIGETITLDDYLKMYLENYTEGLPRDLLEAEVKETLDSVRGLEVRYSVRPSGVEALEIDFVVRLGNQVGVGEVKRKGAKRGIDQINAVAAPRYLGTYIKKFLVSGKEVDRNNRILAEAYGIKVVELTSFSMTGKLSQGDREKLIHSILEKLGGDRR